MLHGSPKRTKLNDCLFSFGVALLFFSFLSKTIHLWNDRGLLLGSFRSGLLVSALFFAAALYRNRGTFRGLSLEPTGFSLALVVVFFSDWFTRPYSLFPGSAIRGEILLFSLLSFIVGTKHTKRFLILGAAITPILLLWCFFQEAGGRLLFSDDHPAVFYRLSLLKEHFPFIPVYNPLWNGGLDARDFFSTGILNLFFLTFPLIYTFDLGSVYNLIIALVIFGILPLSTYAAAKREQFPSPAPEIAALLSLTANLLWYRWCFKYGSMGFIVSTTLFPLALSYLSQILNPERVLKRQDAICSVLVLTLFFFWSLSSIAILPAAVFGLFHLRKVLRKKYFPSVVVALLVLNLSWIVIFVQVSSVTKFVTASHQMSNTDTDHHALQKRITPKNIGGTSFSSSLKRIQENSIKFHPLLLFLSIPGFLFIPSRHSRALFTGLALWLLIAGSTLSPVFPQLDLERMFLFLSFLLVLPTSLSIVSLYNQAKNFGGSFRSTNLFHFIVGFIFAGIFSTSWIIHNRSLEQYYFENDRPQNLVEIIKKEGGKGRTLFSGFVLHELQHGHIAPLVLWSNHPLIASAPVHSSWARIDVIPDEVRERGDESVEEYLDLLNVTSVLAHERRWRNYFDSNPEKYRRVWEEKRFIFYTREMKNPTYFLEGDGEIISQTTGDLTLHLTSSSAVIKFRYYPFLKSTGCSLEPQKYPGDLTFIMLTHCSPGSQVIISARPGWSRVLNEFLQ